jgi:cell division protein FtsI/penicillin-binding protein 2
VSADPAAGHSSRRGLWAAVASVSIVAVGAGLWWWLQRPDPPEPTAQEFASAWSSGDLAGAPVPVDAPDRYDEVVAGLDGSPVEVAVVEVIEDPDVGARATAELAVAWTLPGDRAWEYEVKAPMVHDDEGWTVDWSVPVVHPELMPGGVLDLRRTTPERADIEAADGTPLVTLRPVVDVGIQPSRVEDLDDTVETVADLLDVDGAALRDRVEAADDDAFVPVITLRQPDFEDVEAELFPVPGTVFRRGELPLAPTRTFASPTLGAVREVTAEMIEEQPDRYQPGDLAGTSGLQAAFDEQLFGRPGLQVVAVPPEAEASDDEEAPDEGSDADPAEPVTVFEAEPEAGEPLTVTLDGAVQRAADAAVAEQEDLPASLVAVRVSDGHVLAVANGPAAPFDLGLGARLAPGSTFKVVTTAALLEAGTDPDDTVACPGETTIDGRRFTNAEDAELGEVSFREVFAESCNTAFVQLAQDLDEVALQEAAGWFGLDADHAAAVGTDAFLGDVPVTEGGTDQAASAIGQGRILASPLGMATVAAAVARDGALAPSLVLDDAATDGPETEVEPLPDGLASDLAELMRAVVTDGSGTAVADVPGAPVHGKTGTAEYGEGSPPRTHAWFLGYQDDIAFAALVAETEDSFGGRVAAPIAADFLSRLADG